MKGETASITHMSLAGMAVYTSGTMLSNTLMKNGFREDGLGPALILAHHCVQRSQMKMGDVFTNHPTGT